MKRLIYLLMTMLGFGVAGCEHWLGVAEYGCPHVDFKLSARVVDESGEPIQGICVEVGDRNTMFNYEDYYTYHFDNDTGYSDYLGRIDARVSMMDIQNKAIFTDVDGELNGGEFAMTVVDIEELIVKTKDGDGSWYRGGYEVALGDVVMKRKAVNQEVVDDEQVNEQ